MRLEGKVAIVSGGGGAGIGRAIAELYAREGAAVVVGDLNQEGAESVAGRIEENGGRAMALKADASLAEDVQRLVQTAVDSYGKLTTIVNVASWAVTKYLHEMSEAEWERTMNVGLKSCFLTAHYGLPEMMKLGRSGGCSVVSISSANGIITNPNFGGYSSAKAGMLGFTRSLAMDYGQYGIRANAICPGLILNDRSRPRVQADEEEWRGNVECYPLGTIGEPDDIAYAALYLASDEAKWVTGTTMVVDGGLTIQSVEAVIRPAFRKRWRKGTVAFSYDD
jgi:NAD(P)-dependent dehydrogenase (short-subunit alcohol dehydrogenase family)